MDKKPIISIVAAMSENRIIGKDNKIPWHIKEDLVHLKNLIKGHTVILGRKTYESLVWYYDKSGRPMPGKLYIIVTNNTNYQTGRENTLMVHSIDEALERAQGENEIFVIGGQRVFEQTIDKADKLYLTIVKGDFEGDAFFPDYSEFKTEVARQEGQENGFKYAFVDLVR